jgi:nitrile hydratase
MHEHEPHAPAQEAQEAYDGHELAYYEQRLEAVQALLIEKGMLTADEVRQAVEDMDSRSPAVGAKVVAHAWVDPAFKKRLLTDAKDAISELGIDVDSWSTLVAVENTDAIHNVIVCTLCSCYPRPLLGLPPDWYKSLNYRARVVKEPRTVLKEFGLELESGIDIRVYDSTADMRYLVIPARPAGTQDMSEEELAELVTRDSMIGVTQARVP